MQRPLLTAVLFVIALLANLESASAERYTRHVNGKELVVHTNPLPVVAHRLVPPYWGKHVTQRSLTKGRLPRGAR